MCPKRTFVSEKHKCVKVHLCRKSTEWNKNTRVKKSKIPLYYLSTINVYYKIIYKYTVAVSILYYILGTLLRFLISFQSRVINNNPISPPIRHTLHVTLSTKSNIISQFQVQNDKTWFFFFQEPSLSMRRY